MPTMEFEYHNAVAVPYNYSHVVAVGSEDMCKWVARDHNEMLAKNLAHPERFFRYIVLPTDATLRARRERGED